MNELLATAAEPVQLGEPDLAYYLALRARLDEAKAQVALWQQALEAIVPVLAARHGIEGHLLIDSAGFYTTAPEEDDG
jgi:hypothetical protein